MKQSRTPEISRFCQSFASSVPWRNRSISRAFAMCRDSDRMRISGARPAMNRLSSLMSFLIRLVWGLTPSVCPSYSAYSAFSPLSSRMASPPYSPPSSERIQSMFVICCPSR